MFFFLKDTKILGCKVSHNYENSKKMHVLGMMIQKIKSVKQNI